MLFFRKYDYVVYDYPYKRNGLFRVIGQEVEGLIWIQHTKRGYRVHERIEYLQKSCCIEIELGERV